MKKFYVLPFIIGCCHVIMAQTKLDTMLVNVDKSSVTSGIIYERVTQFANLYNFNRPNYPNKADYKYLRQGLSELYRASNETRLINLKTLEARIASTTNPNAANVAIINSNFEILNYNYEDENAGGLTLNPNTEQFSQIPNEPPFYTLQTTIVAPTKSVVKGSNAVFHFNSNLYLTNGSNGIKTLTVDFGTTTRTIVNNGVFQPQTVTVGYTSSGTKELTCQITFNNNDTLTTIGSFYFHYQTVSNPNGLCTGIDTRSKDEFIVAEESFRGFAPDAPLIVPRADYRTFFADATFHSDLEIYKPVIIIDGFDPGDKRKIQDCDCEEDADCSSENLTNGTFDPLLHRSMENLMEYQDGPETKFILNDLRSEGYDVLMVNHPTYETTNLDTGQDVTIDGGAYYIESNAMALVALIKRVKQEMAAVGSTEKISIVGPSMGGQISRYALAYMEKKYAETNDPQWQHNVNLWVSVDSPHLGANIPLGDQALLFMAGEMSGSDSAQDFYENQLGSPAARQQLIEFHRDPTQPISPSGWPYGNYQINEANLNGRVASQGYGSDDGSSDYRTYYNKQENNGLPNSHGYPQNLRKIALVNGSMSGKTIGYHQERVLNVRGFQNVNIDLPWPLGSINFDVHVASLESYFMSQEFTGNKKIARFKAGFNDKSHYSTNINSRGNMDIAPGGWYPAQQEIWNSISGTTPLDGSTGSFWGYPGNNIVAYFSDVLGGSFFSLRDLRPEHSFISSFSAIAHTNPDQSWLNPLNYNLVCEGDTYFDSYFGHDKNTQHTSFNAESADWLFKELAGNPQEPYFPVSKNALAGPDFVCDNQNSTYSFDLCKIPGQVAQWDISSNLQVVSSNGTSVTVTTTSSQDNSGTIKAIFSNGVSVSKTVFMGAPNAYTLDENGNRNYMGATYNFEQQHNGFGEFSVFSDSPNTTMNFTGPSNTNWNQINANTVEISLSISGSYTFNANATNGCGVHPYFVVVNIGNNSGGGFGNFRVMQNPIDTETLSVIETDDGQSNIDATESNNNNGNGNGNSNKVTLEFYDFNSNLLKTKKINRNQIDRKYDLNVSEFSNDNYFIRIIYNSIDEVYQVILDR